MPELSFIIHLCWHCSVENYTDAKQLQTDPLPPNFFFTLCSVALCLVEK